MKGFDFRKDPRDRRARGFDGRSGSRFEGVGEAIVDYFSAYNNLW